MKCKRILFYWTEKAIYMSRRIVRERNSRSEVSRVVQFILYVSHTHLLSPPFLSRFSDSSSSSVLFSSPSFASASWVWDAGVFCLHSPLAIRVNVAVDRFCRWRNNAEISFNTGQTSKRIWYLMLSLRSRRLHVLSSVKLTDYFCVKLLVF